MSTAHDLPIALSHAPYGDAPELDAPAVAVPPALRLVPAPEPLDFEDAVRRVRPRLHRYAIRRLGDRHEAEELVQEALLRAYSHREQLATEEDLSAWTTVVTGRLVIDRLRVRGRSMSVAEVPETGRAGRDTADVVVARDEARTALDALDAMPPRQAALLWAREVEGQSYDELCVRFGMTEPAVRSVLTRARKALRKEYAVRGGTLPVGGLAVLAPWIAGLGWAGKLRAALGRVTSPAVLATVGVTALGGLLVAPFGIGHGPRGSFAPTTAVVSSAATAALPYERHTVVATRPSVRNASPSAPAAVASRPAGLDPIRVTGLVNQTPCTYAEASTDDPLTDPGYPLVRRLASAPAVRSAGPRRRPLCPSALPVSVEGDDELTVSTDSADCSTFAPITSTGLVRCTQESQR